LGKAPNWTKEELDYLQDSWGTVSIKGIANHLGRSTNAVKLKAQRVGLQDPRMCFDGITVNQLALALNISYSILKNWIKLYNFPARRKIFAKENRVLVITYQSFWKWAEQNKQMIDFARVEPNILGPEPDWVKTKRGADLIKAQKIKKSYNNPWTKDEDNTLRGMLNAYMYTYPEIASRLNRSEGAVKRRIKDLGLKARPVRLNNHIKYTDEEVKTLVSLYEKGYCLEDIAQKIGKSALGIRGKLERLGYKFRNGVPIKELSASG
jgi:hypothetical protein